MSDDDLYDPRPDEDAPPSPAYRYRSDDTWDLARDAYLAGETAAQVCARFDLGLSAFWDRARREGWRRCDRSDPEPLPVDADDDIDFDAGYAELADHALRQLRRAMARGRASAAASWMRLHDRLIARAREEADAEQKIARAAAALHIQTQAQRAAEADPEYGVARAAIEGALSRLHVRVAAFRAARANNPNNPNTFFAAPDDTAPPDP